jgi:long-chain fatty acid transport protein
MRSTGSLDSMPSGGCHGARLSLWGVALWASGAALAATPVVASPLFELVGDTQGNAGLNPRASSPGAASTYFNPSLLPEAPSGVTLGFFFLTQQIELHLDARASSPVCPDRACDVPAVNDAGPASFRHADGSPIDTPALPTLWLEQGRTGSQGESVLPPRPRQAAGSGQSQHGFIALGLVQSVIPDRVGLGLYTLLPIGDFMRARAFYSDEREQFFSNSLHSELYADRLSAASMAFGAGVRLSAAFSLGLSLTLAIQSSARAPAYVSNLSDLDSLLLDSDVGVNVSLSPHMALSYRPSSRLRLSATAHSPQSVQIETQVAYVIATGIEQRAQQSFTHGYLPWIFGLGAEVGLSNEAAPHWSLAATATYALWSRYRDRHSQSPSAGFAWSNVAAVSAGVHYAGTHLRGFLDADFHPSPVPPQTGRTNYVDNDRLGGAIGGSYAFSLWGHAAEAGLSAQLHALLPRSVVKTSGASSELVRDELPDDAIGGTPRGPIPGREGLQTNNPGFPGFGSQGFIVGVGARLGLAF